MANDERERHKEDPQVDSYSQETTLGKPVTSLSGGEKARLSLAKLMLQKSNTLILDEPTNHLDLDSKEILENALDDFPGTILFVSHDRYFINRLATKVIDIGSSGSVEYLGDYDYYLEKKLEQAELLADKARAVLVDSPPAITKQDINKETKRQERRLPVESKKSKHKFLKLDIQIESLQNELLQPEFADDHIKLMEIQNNINQLQIAHDEKAEKWLELQEQLEEL